MSTSNTPENEATTSIGASSPNPKAVTVFDIIKSQIQSEFTPARKEYVLFGKDRKPQCYRAEFELEGNLRRYLSVQNQMSREKKKFSSLISFTSGNSGADALAVPANIYVRDTWGRDGTKILQMVENAMESTDIRGVSAS